MIKSCSLDLKPRNHCSGKAIAVTCACIKGQAADGLKLIAIAISELFAVQRVTSTYYEQQEAFMPIFKILLSILLPPLGVFLQEGLNSNFWISVVLTILGYIPGIVFALYILLSGNKALA